MWLATLTFVSFIASVCLTETLSSFLFCADMNPQQYINIKELLGIWHGIEIINHHSEEHYVRIGTSCPILHISEEKFYFPTHNPLYKNYDFQYNYGERRPPTKPTGPTNRPTPTERFTEEYGSYQQYPYQRSQNARRYGTQHYDRNYLHQMRGILIWWDENGSGIEYHLRYNTSKPGFWISSGPQNGSELEPQYRHFAGTVQVIKAVGSHLVLTFCHTLPEKQLFSIILSRETQLGQADTVSVHNLLNRRGLSANAVKKVCWNGSDRIDASIWTLIVLVFILVKF